MVLAARNSDAKTEPKLVLEKRDVVVTIARPVAELKSKTIYRSRRISQCAGGELSASTALPPGPLPSPSPSKETGFRNSNSQDAADRKYR